MCPVCPNFSKQWGCLDIKTVMGNMVAAQGVREKTFFFSPWEQTIAARISLKVATKDRSIGRGIVGEYLRCFYRGNRDQWPDQAILLVLQVKHN